MGKVVVTGSIIASPEGSGSFPTSVLNVALALAQVSGKGFTAGTGILRRAIASPSAFVTLEGVPGTVAQAGFLYVRCDSPIDLRLTYDDGAGGDTVSVVPVHGPLLQEMPAAKFLKLLEAQGTAAIEYMLTG